MNKIDPKELSLSPFTAFDKNWALVCAGPINGHNAMTISWGELGTLWGKSVATVYVKPARHTYSFMEKNDLRKIAEAHLVDGSPRVQYYMSVCTDEMEAIRETVFRQARIMKEMGQDIRFEEVEGSHHDHPYCDREIKRVITEMLPLRRSPIYPDAKE